MSDPLTQRPTGTTICSIQSHLAEIDARTRAIELRLPPPNFDWKRRSVHEQDDCPKLYKEHAHDSGIFHPATSDPEYCKSLHRVQHVQRSMHSQPCGEGKVGLHKHFSQAGNSGVEGSASVFSTREVLSRILLRCLH